MFQNVSDLWGKFSHFIYILRKKMFSIIKNVRHNFVEFKLIYGISFFFFLKNVIIFII